MYTSLQSTQQYQSYVCVCVIMGKTDTGGYIQPADHGAPVLLDPLCFYPVLRERYAGLKTIVPTVGLSNGHLRP